MPLTPPPVFVGGFQTVDNTDPWQNSQPGLQGVWGGDNTIQGGTAIGVGIPYDYKAPFNAPVIIPNNPGNTGDALIFDNGNIPEWVPTPVSPTPLEVLQQLIAQGLIEIGEDGTLRAVPALPAPRSETKPATKSSFTYIDEEELYLEVERFE